MSNGMLRVWALLLALAPSVGTGAVAETQAAGKEAPSTGARVAGSVSSGTAQWPLHDVWIYHDHDLLHAVFSDHELDPAELLADGVLEAADFDRAHAAGASLLRLGMVDLGSGFVLQLVSLQWQPHGAVAVLLPGKPAEDGLLFDKPAYVKGFFRGHFTADLPMDSGPFATERALEIQISFDVAMLGGPPGRRPGKTLPADGGAPGAMLRKLQADAANSRQADWREHLHPELRQRWEQIWSKEGLDVAALRGEGANLIPLKLERVHGWEKNDQAQLYASDPDGVHWRISLQRSDDRWLKSELLKHPRLPAAGELSSSIRPSMWAQGAQQRQQETERGTVLIIGLIALSALCFAVLIVVGIRRYKAETAHLAAHGIHTTARVTGLKYAGSGKYGRCPVHLILQWSDSRTGTPVELTSARFTLDRKGTFDSAGITLNKANTRVHLLGEWPVQLDPDQPKRYHRVGELERARQILQEEN